MKIKFIFTVPPYDAIQTEDQLKGEEQIIFIADPYKITMVEGGRQIETQDGTKINYEQYCLELQEIIANTVRNAHLEKNEINSITITGCKEPPNFETLHRVLARTSFPVAKSLEIYYKDCNFSGNLAVNALKNLVRSVKKRDKEILFDITTEDAKSNLSDHDKAKLAAIYDLKFHAAPGEPALIPRITDDQLIGTKPFKTPEVLRSIIGDLMPDLRNPTFFYRAQMGQKFSPSHLLKNFFSQAHQQRNDYTCGPSAIKMVADYYVSLGRRKFCGEAINFDALKNINILTEYNLSQQVKTTEEEGSELADIREGLMNLGLHVFDDCDGYSPGIYDDKTLQEHKEKVLAKIEQLLDLGIPVIVNMRDPIENVGHYEVVIGIEPNKNIILAEPGGALVGQVQFESISQDELISRWRNMSGERHGRFLVVSPNEATTTRIKMLLDDLPHYDNGESRSKAEAETSINSTRTK